MRRDKLAWRAGGVFLFTFLTLTAHKKIGLDSTQRKELEERFGC